MASRNFSPVQALDKEVKFLFGIVTFGASGAIGSQTSYGFTVTKPAGTGLYRVTLADLYPELLGMWLLSKSAAAADVFFQQQTDMSAGGVIDFQHIGAGSAANATSGDKVNILLIMKNSTVLP